MDISILSFGYKITNLINSYWNFVDWSLGMTSISVWTLVVHTFLFISIHASLKESSMWLFSELIFIDGPWLSTVWLDFLTFRWRGNKMHLVESTLLNFEFWSLSGWWFIPLLYRSSKFTSGSAPHWWLWMAEIAVYYKAKSQRVGD